MLLQFRQGVKRLSMPCNYRFASTLSAAFRVLPVFAFVSRPSGLLRFSHCRRHKGLNARHPKEPEDIVLTPNRAKREIVGQLVVDDEFIEGQGSILVPLDIA